MGKRGARKVRARINRDAKNGHGGEIELGSWDEPWDMPYGTDGTPLRLEDF